ncbi:MAG: sigma-70 family RNA polymerase sigma factor [Ruminococcaceae bacterium]|nr:sigma-70 family RNA polymerase sigma factor [Oscillospiraceae bacterium]
MTERDKLICENTGLVHSCAKKFTGRGIEYEELCSSGCVGLIKAAKRFDESLGFKFSTYAVPVILGEIKQLFRDSGAVKVSRSIKELSLKINRVCEDYYREFCEEPSVTKIAELLDESIESVAEALSAMRLPVSLSYETEEDSRECDIPVESEEEEITERITLHQHLSELECRDRELINLRYFKGKTQSDTAKVLGMTQVQVSRREKKILLTLRQKIGGE